MKHQILISQDGSRARVELDGQDISSALTGVKVDMRAGHMPLVTLDALVHVGVLKGLVFTDIPQATRELLVSLGWTPPTAPAAERP